MLSLILSLALSHAALPSATHEVIVIRPYDVPDPIDWSTRLKELVTAEPGFAWAHHEVILDHNLPVGGAAERTGLKVIEETVRAVPRARRVHLDVVIDGHGSADAIGAQTHPRVPYETFARELTRILSEGRGLDARFSFRLLVVLCFAGGLPEAFDAAAMNALPFESLVVAATTSDKLAYDYPLDRILRFAGEAVGYARAEGVGFGPARTTNQELQALFPLVEPWAVPELHRSYLGPPVFARFGPGPTVWTLDHPEMLRALARAYRGGVRSPDLTFYELERAYFTPSFANLRENLRALARTSPEPEIVEALTLLELGMGPSGEADWSKRLKVVVASEEPAVRVAALDLAHAMIEHVPHHVFADALEAERQRPVPSRRVLQILKRALAGEPHDGRIYCEDELFAVP